MNLKLPEALSYLDAFSRESGVQSYGKKQNLRFRSVIYAPALYLARLNEELTDLGLAAQFEIGAQNAHGSERGAFTGEISAEQLKSIGIEQTLLGHSERRQHFGETNQMIRARLHGLLEQGIEVLLCVGETLQEREAGITQSVLKEQLVSVLPDLTPNYMKNEKLRIAYEPVWAIGTGRTATPAQANEAHSWVRNILAERFNQDTASRMSILYGGSATAENAESLLKEQEIDGLLIGGASLKPEAMGSILTLAYSLGKEF